MTPSDELNVGQEEAWLVCAELLIRHRIFRRLHPDDDSARAMLTDPEELALDVVLSRLAREPATEEDTSP